MRLCGLQWVRLLRKQHLNIGSSGADASSVGAHQIAARARRCTRELRSVSGGCGMQRYGRAGGAAVDGVWVCWVLLVSWALSVSLVRSVMSVLSVCWRMVAARFVWDLLGPAVVQRERKKQQLFGGAATLFHDSRHWYLVPFYRAPLHTTAVSTTAVSCPLSIGSYST